MFKYTRHLLLKLPKVFCYKNRHLETQSSFDHQMAESY